jgi:Na+-transporting NADH:ubiquinone oxidoreductase subunit NqrB
LGGLERVREKRGKSRRWEASLREFLFASAGAKLSGEYWKASPQGFAGDPSLLKYKAADETATEPIAQQE